MRVSIYSFALTVLLGIAFISYTLPNGSGVPENGSIYVPYRENIPNINGQWDTPSEWTDGNEIILQNEFEWTVYIRIKHNQTHLFILLDFITDQSESSLDSCGICFDTLDNGGNFPRVDDYEFLLYCFDWSHYGDFYFYHEVYQGRGTGGYNPWVEIEKPLQTKMEMGFSSINDPYEGNRNHRIYEFQIPCSFLGQGYYYGFYAFVFDSGTDTLLEWPTNAGGVYQGEEEEIPPAPGNWGDIESDTEFVPEFSSFIALFSFMIATQLVLTIVCRGSLKGVYRRGRT